MKRLISALLCAAICLGLASVPALAAAPVTAHTALDDSAWAKVCNIEIAAGKINGTVVRSGESFSFNETVGPRTADAGYQSAHNGRGAKVTGGGVAQVATTLYLALCQLGGDIEITEKSTYGSSFTDLYVSSGSDAILVDYSAGIDFAFVNLGDDLRIEAWTSNGVLYCSLAPLTGAAPAPAPAASARRAPIASASFRIDGSDEMRSNIQLAAGSINDSVLSNGDLFSFNASVGPREARYGYKSALNGRGARVVGGGVAQVASVIWLAVKNLDCVAIVEKSTYGSRYSQDYVSSSNDAILTDYNSGTDFSFRYTGDAALTICTYVSGDMLCCDIYQN